MLNWESKWSNIKCCRLLHCIILLYVLSIRDFVNVGIEQAVDHRTKLLVFCEFVSHVFNHVWDSSIDDTLDRLIPKLFTDQREETKSYFKSVGVVSLIVLQDIYEYSLRMFRNNDR